MLKFFAEKMWVAFAMQKLLTFFQQKISEYCLLNPAKTVNQMTLNELVKLTTLWTTGPWNTIWLLNHDLGLVASDGTLFLTIKKT